MELKEKSFKTTGRRVGIALLLVVTLALVGILFHNYQEKNNLNNSQGVFSKIADSFVRDSKNSFNGDYKKDQELDKYSDLVEDTLQGANDWKKDLGLISPIRALPVSFDSMDVKKKFGIAHGGLLRNPDYPLEGNKEVVFFSGKAEVKRSKEGRPFRTNYVMGMSHMKGHPLNDWKVDFFYPADKNNPLAGGMGNE